MLKIILIYIIEYMERSKNGQSNHMLEIKKISIINPNRNGNY